MNDNEIDQLILEYVRYAFARMETLFEELRQIEEPPSWHRGPWRSGAERVQAAKEELGHRIVAQLELFREEFQKIENPGKDWSELFAWLDSDEEYYHHWPTYYGDDSNIC